MLIDRRKFGKLAVAGAAATLASGDLAGTAHDCVPLHCLQGVHAARDALLAIQLQSGRAPNSLDCNAGGPGGNALEE